MKKIVLVISAIALVAIGIYIYSAYRSAQKAQAAAAAIETYTLETGDLEATISATGKVRSSQSATLTWQTSGTVENVAVREGDLVKAGDTLATLQQTSLPQSVILAQADLSSAQQALQDLNTEAEAAKVQAMQDIVTYEQAVRDAQYQLDNFTVPSNQSDLDTVTAVRLMKQALDEARLAFEPYKYKSSGDQVRESLLEALSLAQSDYDSAIKRLQYEYDLEVAQANLEKAHQDYEKWKDGPVPADVKAAQAKIAAEQASLRQAWIEAPFDGTISLVDAQVGDQVSANTEAFRLDNLTTLFIDLEVSEIDVQQVKARQAATITLDALRDKEYHGQVVKVAMVSAEDASVVNFLVTVSLTDADENVRPGMTSEVVIVTDRKEGVLLVPNQAIQTENGAQMVYVMQAGQGMVPVEVNLGIASETYTEVVSGALKAGDLVVLNPDGDGTTQSGMPGMIFGGPGGPPPGGDQPSDNGEAPVNSGGQS